ncbi:MAG: glutamate formimidoyltransferase [Phycisphaerae bacterium]|nr:glutamate formimidoyltransferase [Phycisphaerae bacterium]
MRLVECVPNFSEGREPEIINKISATIEAVDGVKLLHVDSGYDVNRTVMTFIGSPEQVGIAAFNAIAKAYELVDMAKQSGTHPRMGSTDVCPFIPVSNVTIEECLDLARNVARRVGDELGIPVYLYEKSATQPERQNLADIRRGQYEGLPEKLKLKEWKPDFGPTEFNPKAGATVMGVREFLIAYNINLNTRDIRLASQIAGMLRATGYKDINKQKIPGKFQCCKAIGWVVDEFDRAQISMNLTDYKVTPIHVVMEEARNLAADLGLVVTGSEIIGMIPYDALLATGKYYLQKQGQSTFIAIRDILETAIQSLGLRDCTSFIIKDKVLGLPDDFC